MNTWNIADYGASSDGKMKNTDAFARAIDAAAAAGGGKVIVPRGTWLTGPIRLKSDVELHLESGATVLFSRDYDDFPLVITDYEGEQAVRCLSPISGTDLLNVAITGDGVFDGQGEVWRPVKRKKLSDQEWRELLSSGGAIDEATGVWYPTIGAKEGTGIAQKLRGSGLPLRAQDYAPARDALRPNLLKLTRCKGLRLDGPTFRNSPAWNLHLLLC